MPLTSGVGILSWGVVLCPVVRRPRGDDDGAALVVEDAVEPPGGVAAVASGRHAAARPGVQEGSHLGLDGLSKSVRC